MITGSPPTAEAQISGLLFAVLLLDPDLKIIEANHASEDMFGRSANRLIGEQFEVAAMLSEAVGTRIRNADAQLVARGLSMRSGSQNRRVNLTVSPLSTYPGWRVVTLSDAGQDDMRSEGDLQAGLKAPAILAHEIKNPLAAIKGASQLLSRKVEAGDKRLTGMIVDEVDRIARLIDRMQELGSRANEPPRPVNLHQSVRKAMASARSAIKGNAELVEEFDPSLPPVMANPDALEQILINLIANAVDATAELTDPLITVRTRFVSGLATNVAGSGQSVRLPIEIAVCDNGKGLASELGEHVFEPFVTSKKNGQGLGLALVKKLTADMGGRVSHTRIDATGVTEFRVHLALAD